MLERISSFLWEIMFMPLLVSGVYLTFRFGFIQLRPKRLLKSALSSGKKSSHEISQLQSVCTSLAATMGTGNIIGVSSAIAIGGAGAVFWMWVSAFFGMALAYAENYLSVRYRSETVGGAMLYLKNGVKSSALSVLYALFCVLASFGIGNMTQSNSIASAAESIAPPAVIGSVTAILAATVILGGAKRIGSAAERLVPILSVLYILMSILIIVYNHSAIPDAFSDIFRGAFGIRSAVGGVGGYALRTAISTGLRRGVFSNEAGMGSAGIVHAAAPDCLPKQQGAWGVIEVFIDTTLCCTLTALVLLTSGTVGKYPVGAQTVTAAFSSLFGNAAEYIISAAIILFAFATIIGWELIGEKAWQFLFKGKATLYYKYIYIVFILIGAVLSLDSVWYLSDIFNALMIAPNLIGLLFLSRKVEV